MVELTHTKAEVLSAIALNPEMDTRELADHLGISVQAVSNHLSDFRAHGMVVREPGRRVEYTLKGNKYFEDDEPEWMVTGRGRRIFAQYVEGELGRVVTLYESLVNSRVYRPPHVIDTENELNAENLKSDNRGD